MEGGFWDMRSLPKRSVEVKVSSPWSKVDMGSEEEGGLRFADFFFAIVRVCG